MVSVCNIHRKFVDEEERIIARKWTIANINILTTIVQFVHHGIYVLFPRRSTRFPSTEGGRERAWEQLRDICTAKCTAFGWRMSKEKRKKEILVYIYAWSTSSFFVFSLAKFSRLLRTRWHTSEYHNFRVGATILIWLRRSELITSQRGRLDTTGAIYYANHTRKIPLAQHTARYCAHVTL